ncbi:flagellar motor protein MotD [Pseudomonadota bacterium]
MARKKKPEEHENHERWLVSYADFITLLFAFFVVMYALSSVNEGKYRVLSDAMIAAFRSAPKSFEPIQVGDPIKAPHDIMQDVRPAPSAIEAIRVPIREQVQIKAHGALPEGIDQKKNMDTIADKLEMALGKMIDRNLISVNKTDNWLEVEIKTSILYGSGSSLLQPGAIPVLTGIAGVLRDFPNAVRVEGFTDNIPIDTPTYPSNWELSAGRAASVVHLFSDEGVDPFRLSAIGYGEYRPKVSNSTPAGREVNRRVVVVILSESADDLYDRSHVKEVEDKRPVKDIDLDAPLPVLEEEITSAGDTTEIPQAFPQGLPLINRDITPEDSENKGGRVTNVLERLEPLSNDGSGQ